MSQPYPTPSRDPANAAYLADSGIPTLQAVLDSSQLRVYLTPVVPSEWGEIGDIRFELLKFHQGRRCTLNFTLETTTGQHQLIGKVYAEGRPEATHRATKQISASGFGPEAEFSIPQPVAFIPELRLLLQEKVVGPLATEIFLGGDEHERARAAERCACWLAHFHNFAQMSGPVFLLTQKAIDRWAERLDQRLASVADKAQRLARQLESSALRLGAPEMCACHGGYCHHQIILSERRAATLDWDHFCISDPTRDVARFIINLQRLASKSLGSLTALDSAIQTFYSTYKSQSRFDVAERLYFYKAAHCLKHARYPSEQESEGSRKTEAMLDEGLRILAEEA